MSTKASILVVEDEKGMQEFLAIFLEQEGYRVTVADSGTEALNKFKTDNFDMVISDLRLPGMDGIALLRKIKAYNPDCVFIIITAYATTETTVQAMKEGAYDYLTKPLNVDQIRINVSKALLSKQLKEENIRLKKEVKNRYQFENIIGKSAAMQKIFQIIERVAQLDSTLLVTGESGTGKEMVAKAVHYLGSRQQKQFVTVNCGALPENLLESELFGHQKGSFTGAVSNKIGLLEIADGGTFFLDEVGETTPAIQVKLLRFLQEKTFKRVGGIKDITVDTRFISATNADLAKAVEENRFREDLYYRLNVIQIKIPPLRERTDDIPLLVNHFVKKYSDKLLITQKSVDIEAMELLVNFHWPGNVRQLENVIEQTVALETSEVITADSLPVFLKDSKIKQTMKAPSIPDDGVNLQLILDDIEKQFLLEAMKKTKGVKKEAAQLLDISFRSLRYRLQKFGLDN